MVIAVCAAAPTGRALSGTEVIVFAAGAGPGCGPERKRAADDSSFHRRGIRLTAAIVR